MASTMKATGSSASAASNSASDRSAAHIWLVTGPAGCGKSTVAQHLATSLDVPYIEGDEVCDFIQDTESMNMDRREGK